MSSLILDNKTENMVPVFIFYTACWEPGNYKCQLLKEPENNPSPEQFKVGWEVVACWL